MKLNTMHQLNFTAEYWDFTSTQGIDGQLQHEYTYEKDIRVSAISAEKGTLYLFHPEQLRYNAQVRKLRDPRGVPVFEEVVSGEDTINYVGLSEPVFDVSGSVIGYRHDLQQGG